MKKMTTNGLFKLHRGGKFLHPHGILSVGGEAMVKNVVLGSSLVKAMLFNGLRDGEVSEDIFDSFFESMK